MISISGRFKSKAELVAEAIDWFFTRFEIDSDQIELNVNMVKDLPACVTADLVQLDEDYQYRLRIKVTRTMETYRLIDRTMHELVHLRQYYTGTMKQNAHDIVTFKGIKYNLSDYETQDNLPWEVEARGEEHNLSYDFCKSKGDSFFKRTISKEVLNIVFS